MRTVTVKIHAFGRLVVTIVMPRYGSPLHPTPRRVRSANEDSTMPHFTSQRKPSGQASYFGSSDAKSGCGRAMTSAMMSFPPSRSTVALPVSMAVWTAATSPRTMIVM